jgi:hypothetical protein
MQDPNIAACIKLDPNIVDSITPDPTIVAITRLDAALYSVGKSANFSDLYEIGGSG